MSALSEEAVSMLRSGFNCTQSVLACIGRREGLSREMAVRLGETFGGGMCHHNQTCGAVTGALMGIGLKYSRGESKDAAGRQKASRTADEFMARFTALNGAVSCTGVLGVDLSEPGGEEAARRDNLFATTCAKAVKDAVEICEDLLGDSRAEGTTTAER